MPPQPKQEELENGFKNVIEDTIPLIQSLAPLCESSDEMISLLSLALENQAQLRLIMRAVQERKK